MREAVSALWRSFFDWVMGNGPRPEDEAPVPELPPELPFTRSAPPRTLRHRERSLGERYGEWMEWHGPYLFPLLYRGLSVLVCVVVAGLLLLTVAELPRFGDPANPANNIVSKRYVERGLEETGATNIVAGMILDYRAFDTFGESAVLFAAAIAVIMLLGDGGRRSRAQTNRAGRLHGERYGDDAILRGVASLAVPVILLLGTAIVVNGHLSPGGGFSGGAVLGTALILYANAWGFDRIRQFFPLRAFTISSCVSLLVYALAKGDSFFTGANHLESGIPLGEPGAILSGGLILPLNICVGIVVSGTLYGFYVLFGREKAQK